MRRRRGARIDLVPDRLRSRAPRVGLHLNRRIAREREARQRVLLTTELGHAPPELRPTVHYCVLDDEPVAEYQAVREES
jgi:hypothetical protein